MCDPVTIALVAASSAYAAKAQIEQGKYMKGVAQYNARVAENRAEEVRQAGTEAENLQRAKTALLLSKQRAQLGAAGVELGSGSALALQESTVTLGEEDALRIRRNVTSQVGALRTGAELTLAQGEAAEAAGRTQAFGTLLSGAASAATVSNKWMSPDSAAYGPAY